MKKCFKCEVTKPLSDFYKHSRMADGHLGECKECTKKDSATNRASNLVKISKYEQERNKTAERRHNKRKYEDRHRQRYPEKHRARQALNNAVRDGKLLKQPCQRCGNPKSQAHHNDYAKPFDVEWLCFKCHREIGHGQHVVVS